MGQEWFYLHECPCPPPKLNWLFTFSKSYPNHLFIIDIVFKIYCIFIADKKKRLVIS